MRPRARPRDAWWRLLAWTLERAGPTFHKLGQWASTRPDLLPPSLCAVLAALHHSVPAHSLAHTNAAILAAFGAPSEALFRSVEAHPIGSGCIAQVHAATLVDGRRTGAERLAEARAMRKECHPPALARAPSPPPTRDEWFAPAMPIEMGPVEGAMEAARARAYALYEQERAHLGAQLGPDPGPVSYTHLTLPTKA